LHRLSLVLSSLLLLLSRAARRNLHSFPTRRSSDLPLRKSSPSRSIRRPGSCRTTAAPSPGRSASRATSPSRPTSCSASSIAPSRSEEHTSELQSRENLVCRLLLEKKKKNDMLLLQM